MTIAVCERNLKKLAYRQRLVAALNGVRITVLLVRYQVSALTRRVQHIEYEQIESALVSVHLPVLFVSATPKLGIKLKAPATKVAVVGSASLVPNYIKVELSSFSAGSQVVFSSLAYRHLRILPAEANCVLAALA